MFLDSRVVGVDAGVGWWCGVLVWAVGVSVGGMLVWAVVVSVDSLWRNQCSD